MFIYIAFKYKPKHIKIIRKSNDLKPNPIKKRKPDMFWAYEARLECLTLFFF